MNGGRGRHDLRVGDAERDAAASMLGEHFVAGRLAKEEYDERVEAAWAARTVGDLRVLFGDLPHPPSQASLTAQSAQPARRGRSRVEGWVASVGVLPVFVVLLVLAVVTGRWALVLLAFVWFWWAGLLQARRRLRRSWERRSGGAGPDWVR